MRQDTNKQVVREPAPNTVPGQTRKEGMPEPEVTRGAAAKAMLEGGIPKTVLQVMSGVPSKAILEVLPESTPKPVSSAESTVKPETTPKKAAPANNPDIPGLLSARRKVMGFGARYRIAEGVLAEEVHVSITPETTVPCYVFTPPGLDSDAELDTIIHVPGTAGKQFVDKAEHVMGSHIAAETGCRVIIPSHRFAPENRWPIPYNDVLRLVNKLLSADGPFNIDRVGLSGYSSGTLIAAQLYLRALKETPCPFAQLFLIAPATDVDASTHLQPHPDPAVNSKQFPSSCFTGFGELMLPEGMDGTSSLISPQYIPQEFYEGKGIVHIVIGELDARIEHVRKFRDTLKAAGVRVHYQEIKECQNCSGCEVCENGLPNHGLPWNNPTFVSVMADEIKQVFAEAEKPDEFVELKKMPRFANRQGVLASITERYKALNYVRHIDPQMPDFSLADHQRLMMVDTGKRKLDISHEEYFTGDKQPIRWQALFNEQNSDAKQCYAITAPPGGGKSSLLHHIVTRFYQGLVGEPGFEAELPDWLQFDWAVHIRLRDMVRYQGQEFGKDFTLRDVLYDLFFRGVKDNKGRLLDEKYFERTITLILENPDKVLLCLDGLDELSNDDTCQTIYDKLLETFKHRLISGRPQAMQEYTQDKAYGVLEIQGLKLEQQQDYARNYCVKQLAREAQQNITVMRERYGYKSQRELAQATDDLIAQTLQQRQAAVLDLLAEQVQLPTHIPVILDIFCFLAMDIVSGKLKAESLNNQSQWYQAMIGKLLERFNRERGNRKRRIRGAPPQIVAEDSKAWRFLVVLAESHEFLEPVFSYEDIKAIIEKLIEQYKDFNQKDIDDLFEPHGLLNCGLLVKSSSADYSYEFLHLSMQEFLYAYSLKQRLQKSPDEAKYSIATNKYDTRFERVWGFMAGLLSGGEAVFAKFWDIWSTVDVCARANAVENKLILILLEGFGHTKIPVLRAWQQQWIEKRAEAILTNHFVVAEEGLKQSPYLIRQLYHNIRARNIKDVKQLKSIIDSLKYLGTSAIQQEITVDLVVYLSHTDDSVRASVLQAFGYGNSNIGVIVDEVFPLFIECIFEDNPVIQEELILSTSILCGDKRLLPLIDRLINNISHRNHHIASHAQTLLGSISAEDLSDQQYEQLARHLRSTDSQVVAGTIRSLPKGNSIENQHIRAAIYECLASGNQEVQEILCLIISQRKHSGLTQYIPKICFELLTSKGLQNEHYIMHVIRNLPELFDVNELKEAVYKALLHDDDQVKQNACAVISWFGMKYVNKGSCQVLLSYINVENIELRYKVIEAVSKLAPGIVPKEIFYCLATSVFDESECIARCRHETEGYRSLTALANLWNKQCNEFLLPFLLYYLRSDNQIVQENIFHLLRRIVKNEFGSFIHTDFVSDRFDNLPIHLLRNLSAYLCSDNLYLARAAALIIANMGNLVNNPVIVTGLIKAVLRRDLADKLEALNSLGDKKKGFEIWNGIFEFQCQLMAAINQLNEANKQQVIFQVMTRLLDHQGNRLSECLMFVRDLCGFARGLRELLGFAAKGLWNEPVDVLMQYLNSPRDCVVLYDEAGQSISVINRKSNQCTIFTITPEQRQLIKQVLQHPECLQCQYQPLYDMPVLSNNNAELTHDSSRDGFHRAAMVMG